MIGAGFMAQGLTNQIVNSPCRAMRLSAIFNRHVAKAIECLRVRRARAGRSVTTPGRVRRRDPRAASRWSPTDPIAALRARSRSTVLVDVTGAVEFGARVVLDAFEHGKHVVLMNAELDATIGPILQVYAQQVQASSCRRATATSPASRSTCSATSKAWA